MKKGKTLTLIAVIIVLSVNIFAISLISATDLTLSKSQYYPGETLQAELAGNFIENLNSNNFNIYQDNIVHPTPTKIGYVKDNTKYYIYSSLPTLPGNYTLKIENARYSEAGSEKTAAIIKNFTIVSTNNSYLSFNPGVILSSNDFSIKIISHNAEQQVTVDYSATGQKETFTLGYETEKEVFFSISKLKNITKSNIKINSYTIPAIINPPVNQTLKNETIAINKSLNELITVYPRRLEATLLEDTTYIFDIELVNKNPTLYPIIKSVNISTTNKNLNLSKKIIGEFSDNAIFYVSIKSKSSFNTSIELNYRNSSISIPVEIIVTKNESNVLYDNIPTNTNRTCLAQGGVKCNSSEQNCKGTKLFSTDYIAGEVCCKGECTTKERSNSWIWAAIIIIILAILAYFLYKRSNRSFSTDKADEIIKKRAENYHDRINPVIGSEVNRSLSKI